MAGTNQFKAFATGGSAYTLTAADYAALTDFLANGFPSGIVDGAKFNTVLRQACMVAASIGKIVSDANLDALDNGDVTTLAARIVSALATPSASTTVAGKVELATSGEMATGTSGALVPPVSAVMSLFSKRSFAENDYIRIPDVPGGLILQLFSVSVPSSGSGKTGVFPVGFTNACRGIIPGVFSSSAGSSDTTVRIQDFTTTGFTFSVYDSGGDYAGSSIYFLAGGY